MLEGIKIVDLTSVLFGPFSTQLLADLGADVIKVEPPQGDSFRYTGKPAKTRAMGPAHIALNRGKRSVALNLKDPADAELMLKLIAEADIFVHNVRLNAIERLGLGYNAVAAINPSIIYVHCVGFGSDGPYADAPAYDDVIQAASGATSLSSRAAANSNPRYIPSAVADKVAGLYAANAMLAAIVHRQRTGNGQFVEVPMLETFTDFVLKEHFGGLTYDPPNAGPCYLRQVDPDRQPFPTADGYICIVPYAEDSWDKVMAILGNPEFLDDAQFEGAGQRFRNVAALYQEVGRLTPNQSTAYWVRQFRLADIPAMEARDIGTILEEPHLAAVDFFQRREHPTEGSYFNLRPPVRFSAYTPREPLPAPMIGEHTDAIREAMK